MTDSTIDHSTFSVPAERPTIRDLSGRGGPVEPKVGVVGPHNEGAHVVLECETQGGYPEPTLTWWRDGRLVDDTYELVSSADGLVVGRRAGAEEQQTPEEVGSPEEPVAGPTEETAEQAPTKAKQVAQNRLIRNRLELEGLTRNDLLANYSCQAWNSKLSPPPTSSVMIDMNRE